MAKGNVGMGIYRKGDTRHVSQFLVKDNAEMILGLIDKLEKLGWQTLKAKAVRNKYNEYFLSMTGTMQGIFMDKKNDGIKNAIICVVGREFKRPVVTLETKKKAGVPYTLFTLHEEEYLMTKDEI